MHQLPLNFMCESIGWVYVSNSNWAVSNDTRTSGGQKWQKTGVSDRYLHKLPPNPPQTLCAHWLHWFPEIIWFCDTLVQFWSFHGQQMTENYGFWSCSVKLITSFPLNRVCTRIAYDVFVCDIISRHTYSITLSKCICTITPSVCCQ